MIGQGRSRALGILAFLVAASVVETSVALYFSSLGFSDASVFLLVSAGVMAVLVAGWTEVGLEPVSKRTGAEGKGRRREIKRAREKVGEKPLIGQEVRGAILVLSVFLVSLGVPYVLMSSAVFPSLRSLHGSLPEQLGEPLSGLWQFLDPVYRLDLVYKYALSQNLAALCSLASVLLLRRWRRR